MTELGRMREGVGQLAAVFAALQDADLDLAILTSQQQREQASMLREASSLQADKIEQSGRKEAEKLLQSAFGNMVSGGGMLLTQSIGFCYNLRENSKLTSIQGEIDNGTAYEQAIQNGLEENPDTILANIEDEDVRANINRNAAEARTRLRTLRETTSLREGLTEEQKHQIKYDVAALKANPNDREAISNTIENIRKLKSLRESARQSVLHKVTGNMQQAQALAQMIQMGSQATTTYLQSGVEVAKAEAEKNKALLDYVSNILNQLLQLSQTLYQQNIDKADKDNNAMRVIIEQNRAPA